MTYRIFKSIKSPFQNMIEYTFSRILVVYFLLHFKIIMIINMHITQKNRYISSDFFFSKNRKFL